MMKSEFIGLLREISPTHRDPSESEYRNIEIVYTYHPSIDTKECIVKLWADFGNTIIEDMLPRSYRVQEAEKELTAARSALEQARHILEEKQNDYNSLFS